jgi:hypothetical protein
MTWNIYERVVASCALDFLQAFGIQLDAVEQIIPDPVEDLGRNLNEGDVVVGGNLIEIGVGFHTHSPDFL